MHMRGAAAAIFANNIKVLQLVSFHNNISFVSLKRTELPENHEINNNIKFDFESIILQ